MFNLSCTCVLLLVLGMAFAIAIVYKRIKKHKKCGNCPGCQKCVKQNVRLVPLTKRRTVEAFNPGTKKIPNVCHRIVGKVSPRVQRNLDSFAARHPAMKQIIHRNKADDYMSRHAPPTVYAVYKAIRPEYYAARADLARYMILYKEGGLYLDDKSDFSEDVALYVRKFPEVSLHAWRWDTPHWPDYLKNKKGEIVNWGMISAPQNTILKEMILNVCVNAFEDNGDEGGKFAVLRTTGPLMWSFIVQDYEGDPNVRISTESTSPAKYTVFDTMNAHEGLTRTYYGDLKTSVFRKEMLPDKHQLEAEIQDM